MNAKFAGAKRPIRQKGTALVFALVFLIAITLMAVASIKTSVMELKVAGNLEENMNAFQTAQAVIDAVFADPANLATTGKLEIEQPINLTSLPLSYDPLLFNGGDPASPKDPNIAVEAKRYRTRDCVEPPPMRSGYDISNFSAFTFRLTSQVDKTANTQGRASIRQGYFVLGPKCSS